MNIPSVTVDQMREVDRLMVEEFGVSILMMMENASRDIAELAREVLGGSLVGKKIVVLSHKGNNGGDGLGAARHLVNYGAEVRCYLTAKEEDLAPDALTQYKVLKKTNVPVVQFTGLNTDELINALSESDLIIDSLLGYNLKGNPRSPIVEVINLANNSGKPILAIDIPSGMNGDTGEIYEPAIKAKWTLTLALPKIGLLKPEAGEYVGELYVGDLSVPKEVYERIGIEVSMMFERKNVVKYEG